MQKVLFLVLALGMVGIAHAAPTTVSQHSLNKGPVVSDAHCKYKLDDARSGLKDLVAVGFVPRQTSPDGNRQMGFMFYHNPDNKDAESVDAFALIMVDKRAPDKELTFMVVYVGPKQSVVFKREVSKDGKSLGPCFERSLEDNPQKTK